MEVLRNIKSGLCFLSFMNHKKEKKSVLKNFAKSLENYP